MRSINEKYGYWAVDNLKFDYKFDALRAATLSNGNVSFVFHDHVWDNFDRTQLGKQSINSLYRERAQQLRDTYDYLILYYSGGSDSHTILRTFLDNNIKIDELCIKWPKPFRDGRLYVVNSQDTSARNYWSEWDYCVKPVLDILKSTHPEIYINIIDYAEDFDTIKMESVFKKSFHVRSGGCMIYTSSHSNTERKSIGHIYGVDKPILSLKNDTFRMHFSDIGISVISKLHDDDTDTECFFWSADMPILAYEMAYQTAEYYIKHESARKYLWGQNNEIPDTVAKRYQADVAIRMIYETWDYRFQSDKPTFRPGVHNSEKFFWFAELPEFCHLQREYTSILNDQLSAIDSRFLKPNGTDFKVCSTKGFEVRKL
jgi:hypothetical protein